MNKLFTSFTNQFTRIKRYITDGVSSEQTAVLFTLEGIFLSITNNIIINNNNLYATRLGASNFQISLVTSLPQLVGMIALIPGGMITDRMRNKRKMVITTLFLVAIVYASIGFVPLLPQHQVIAFLGLLALSAGPMTLYNASWQAYFSDVVDERERNRVYAVRTRWTFAVAITVPLITGTLLVSAKTVSAKIGYHQFFFWIATLLILIQILVLKRISGGGVQPRQRMSVLEIKREFVNLLRNKRYMRFVVVALFFYMVWQSDWSLYYLAQVNYLKYNEQWLSFVVVGGATIQFLSIGFWSRVNERFGMWSSMVLGALSLAIYPVAIIISTSLPLLIGKPLFIAMIVLAGFGFTAILLNILQCLLQVIPKENKTLSISVYTVLITLSNVVMPMLGVEVYTALGASKGALHTTYVFVFLGRIIAVGLWMLLWRQNKLRKI